MAEESNSQQLIVERAALIERIVAPPFATAWDRVREILLSAEPLNPREPLPTVYEGPRRCLLLPLPYEAPNTFVKRYGQGALDCLYEHSNDANALLAAYCLYGIYSEEDPRFSAAARRVVGRTERIATIYGCFAWQGTLTEYVQEQLEDYPAGEA